MRLLLNEYADNTHQLKNQKMNPLREKKSMHIHASRPRMSKEAGAGLVSRLET